MVVSGVAKRIHVVLLDADGNEGASHTLVYAGGAWDVLAGQQGAAQRTFRMTAAQALDDQRHAYKAMRANNPVGWTAFVSLDEIFVTGSPSGPPRGDLGPRKPPTSSWRFRCQMGVRWVYLQNWPPSSHPPDDVTRSFHDVVV